MSKVTLSRSCAQSACEKCVYLQCCTCLNWIKIKNWILKQISYIIKLSALFKIVRSDLLSVFSSTQCLFCYRMHFWLGTSRRLWLGHFQSWCTNSGSQTLRTAGEEEQEGLPETEWLPDHHNVMMQSKYLRRVLKDNRVRVQISRDL